jgi:transcriptional regulator with XRE-family HTH domain
LALILAFAKFDAQLIHLPTSPAMNSIYLSKNLKYLRERKNKQSQTDLGIACGVTRSAVSSYEDGRAEPKLENLIKFANYFNVSVDQLLKVDLVKLDDDEIEERQEVSNYVKGDNLRVLTVKVDGEDNETIDLVPQKAAAGYTTGYADKQYLAELPTYSLPFLPKDRTYRAFEIQGDSMLPILPGSVVVGEYITDWNNIKDGDVCIVVSKSDGIVLKKIFNRVKERNQFLLKSTNLMYEPYDLGAEEVVEIWKFSVYISKKAPEDNSSYAELKDAFFRLEDDVRQLKLNINPN